MSRTSLKAALLVLACGSPCLAQNLVATPMQFPPPVMPPPPGYDAAMDWSLVQNSGGKLSSPQGFEMDGTVGQALTAELIGDGGWTLESGFWSAIEPPAVVPCYANCDSSTVAPVLNIGDFTCFLQRFAAADPYANCDESTVQPVLNVGDFTCFLQRFAAGCP
jgi:hypothetical protein